MNRVRLRRQATSAAAVAALRIAGTSRGARLTRYVRTLDRLLHNDSGRMTHNGEAWLLGQLGPGAAVVFDVGANRGSWTRQATQLLPAATVHSFEPIPASYACLAAEFESNPRVILNSCALSSQPGELRMWADTRDGQMSSATAPPEEGSTEIVVSCATGDEYVRSHGIERVDMLKVDVEGHEMEVLEGFGRSIDEGVIDLVQFEFTLWSARARRWLADYYEFFEPRGFYVGKLWPRRVGWKDYSAEDEEFFRCNFVAVRAGSQPARLLDAG